MVKFKYPIVWLLIVIEHHQPDIINFISGSVTATQKWRSTKEATGPQYRHAGGPLWLELGSRTQKHEAEHDMTHLVLTIGSGSGSIQDSVSSS
jgi:hypothetical protein